MRNLIPTLSLILAAVRALALFVCVPVRLVLTLHICAVNILGNHADGTQCQGWRSLTDDVYTFNQQWVITRIPETDAFTLRNSRGGTYLDLSNGSSSNETKVQGWSKAAEGFASSQQWRISTDPEVKGYRLQNVASNTYLDLAYGSNKNGTKVQGYEYVDAPNQRWDFRRVSRSAPEIAAMVKAHPSTGTSFTNYVQDGIYIVLPENVRKDIYNHTGLSRTKWRREIFDCDDFAIVAKAAVARWGGDYIRADGFAILFGVMFGQNAKGERHAYNWFLREDLNDILFFEPQNGREMDRPGFTGFFGLF